MNAWKSLFIFTGCAVFLSACEPDLSEETNEQPFTTFDYGADIEEMISKMSIEEKVGQMTQINLDVISVGEVFNLVEPHQLDEVKLDSAINHYFVGSILNVGGHTYTRGHWDTIITNIQTKAIAEGNHIPIFYGIDAIHGVNYTVGATLFPQEIGQAATWNPDLVHQAASITAYECRASGIPWNFSPVLDMGRQPLWSRFFETYGEDVHLAKAMTNACITGYQGEDPAHPEKVASCMKHFLGYSVPLSGKDRTPAWIPDRQLREYFLPTFETAIADDALTVMINSGEVNGIPVHANPEILTTLLRDELGFKGLAVTDWEDIIKLYRDHKIAKDMDEAVKLSIMAGIDMSMTPNNYSFNRSLIRLVKNGEVPESRLDESCRRILWVKQQLGILDNPIPDFSAYNKFGGEEHKTAALNAALESVTLLKNEEATLPLDKSEKVFVCGPAANSLNILNGAWTHTWQGVDDKYNTEGANTIYQALQNYAPGKVEYAMGSELDSITDLKAAIAKAKRSDVIVICLGEIPNTEKPGDIEDLNLPQAQQDLVNAMSKLGKPIVFVMVFNRPLIVRQIEPHASAILHAYLPGDFGGDALAKLLYGEVSPSGKLPFTYPRHTGSFVTYDHKHTEKLDKNFGYNAFNPQWEFGHGLSYAAFNYTELALNKDTFGMQDTIHVAFQLANSSDITAKEVTPVYISDLVASITPSVKRLRGFTKVELAGNASTEVQIAIPITELAFVNAANEWVVEAGDFELMVDTMSLTFSVK